MNKTLHRLALLTAVALPLRAAGQPAPAAKPPAAKAAATHEVSPLDYVLPEVNFNGNALGDVIDFLRDVVPNFKVVVVRNGGATEADDPHIAVRLKDASLGQFLDVLARAYPVEISTVPASRPTDRDVTIVTVRSLQARGVAAAAAPRALGARVYHLASIVSALHPTIVGMFGQTTQPVTPDAVAKERKEALNDLLSLCKAALDQVENAPPAVLQVHEATQTLIFKGTPAQRAALEDVLDALDPQRGDSGMRVVRDRSSTHDADAEQIRVEREAMKAEREQEQRRADERMTDLRARLAAVQRELEARSEQTLSDRIEIERLKVRLEAAEKAAAARPAPESKGKDSPTKP